MDGYINRLTSTRLYVYLSMSYRALLPGPCYNIPTLLGTTENTKICRGLAYELLDAVIYSEAKTLLQFKILPVSNSLITMAIGLS